MPIQTRDHSIQSPDMQSKFCSYLLSVVIAIIVDIDSCRNPADDEWDPSSNQVETATQEKSPLRKLFISPGSIAGHYFLTSGIKSWTGRKVIRATEVRYEKVGTLFCYCHAQNSCPLMPVLAIGTWSPRHVSLLSKFPHWTRIQHMSPERTPLQSYLLPRLLSSVP